jgi:hypothetical protein
MGAGMILITALLMFILLALLFACMVLGDCERHLEQLANWRDPFPYDAFKDEYEAGFREGRQAGLEEAHFDRSLEYTRGYADGARMRGQAYPTGITC